MMGNYGEMGLFGQQTQTSEQGNGVRQLFDSFDSSRQMEWSNQYGQNNQYDNGKTNNSTTYNNFIGGEQDGK